MKSYLKLHIKCYWKGAKIDRFRWSLTQNFSLSANYGGRHFLVLLADCQKFPNYTSAE